MDNSDRKSSKKNEKKNVENPFKESIEFYIDKLKFDCWEQYVSNPNVTIDNLPDINQLLLQNLVWILLYRDSYPFLVSNIEHCTHALISKKSEILLKEFFNEESENLEILAKNLSLAKKFFKEALEEYLYAVKEHNKEFLLYQILSYRFLKDYKVSSDSLHFLKETYEKYFISNSMLEDAINLLMNQKEQ